MMALAVVATTPAAAQEEPTVTDQGDVRTSALPSFDEPTEETIYVGTDLSGEAYRGIVGIDGSAAGADVDLVLVEADDDDLDGEERAEILACAAAEEIEGGHRRGDGPRTDCDDAVAVVRDRTGTWRAGVGELLERPGTRGIVLVPVVERLAAPFTVVFDPDGTSLEISAPSPPPAIGSPVTDRPAADRGGAAAPFADRAAPIFAIPDPVSPGLGTGPVPEIERPPAETVERPPALPDDAAAPAVPPTPAPPFGEPPDAPDRGRFVLVLAASAAGALAMFLPLPRFEVLAATGRRRKEAIVNAEQLQVLNGRFRMLVGATIALVAVIAASVTASVDDAGDLTEDLVAVDALIDDSGGASLGADPAVVDEAGTPIGTGDDPAGALIDGAEPSGGTAPEPGGGAATAPGGDTPSETGGTVPGEVRPPRPAQPLTATDQGVTAAAVRIATVDIDPQFYARFGISDPMTEEVTRAYAAEINETGGILGRRWEPVVVRAADATNEQQITQACGEAFGDQRSFLMVNPSAYSGLANCAAEQGRIISDGGYGSLATTTSSLLEDLAGRYWVAGPSSERLIKAWVDLIASEVGTDVKIGYAEQDDPQIIAASQQFQAELKRRGFPEPSVGRVNQDPSTAAVQINNTIARYRQDGVQLVASFVNAVATGLAQNASESQGYRPEFGYTFSSIAGADNEDFEGFYNRSQMEEAFGVSIYRPVGAPEQAKCQEILDRRAPNISFSASAAQTCHMMFLNRSVMEAAGAELTAGTWARAFGARSAHEGPAFGAATYTPSKRAGADQYRIVRFRNGGFVGDNQFRNI